MKPSSLSSSTIIAASQASKQPQAEAATHDVTFNQVLNREISDRHHAESGNAPMQKEPGNAHAPSSSAHTSQVSASKNDISTDGKDLPQSDGTVTAEQMLLVASLGQANSAPAPSSETVAVDTSAINSGGALAILPKDIVDASQKSIETKTAPSELKTAEPGLNVEKTTGKTAGFDAVMSQINQQNSGQDLGKEKGNFEPTNTQLISEQRAINAEANPALSAGSQSLLDSQATSANAHPDLSASLAPLQQAMISPMQMATHSVDKLTPQIATSGWNQALGQKVVWMVGNEQQSASITLNPPDLGPLQVVLNVSGTQANASFYSSHAEVRHALEAALPKLREMLGDAGIQLGQANVSAGTPQQQNSYASYQPATRSVNQTGTLVNAPATSSSGNTRVTGEGMIDTFA